MIVGDFVEDYEVTVPFQALQMVGHIVHAVCSQKVRATGSHRAIHDFEGDQTYSEKPGHNFTLNPSFADVQLETYDALVLPGGRGPEYLGLNHQVLDAVRHFAREKKPIAAICHAAQLLTAARVVDGRRVSAYPACAPDIEIAGGTYASIGMTEAIADGELVTAPAWPAHAAWLAKFLGVLDQYLTQQPAKQPEKEQEAVV
jgi:protease I